MLKLVVVAAVDCVLIRMNVLCCRLSALELACWTQPAATMVAVEVQVLARIQLEVDVAGLWLTAICCQVVRCALEALVGVVCSSQCVAVMVAIGSQVLARIRSGAGVRQMLRVVRVRSSRVRGRRARTEGHQTVIENVRWCLIVSACGLLQLFRLCDCGVAGFVMVHVAVAAS